MFRGLRSQILLWTILPLAIVLIGIAALGVNSHQSAMRELVAERDGALAKTVAAEFAELLVNRTRLLASTDAMHPESWDTQVFDGGLARLDANGNTVTAIPTREIWNARRAFISHAGTARGLSQPFFENNAWRVLVARPVDADLLVGVFSLPNLATITPRGVTYLVDENGKIIAHPDPTRVGTDLRAHSGITQVTRGESGATFHHDAQGAELVVGYAPISPTSWGLLIEEPWAEVVAPMFQYAVLLPLALLLVAIVALGAIYFGVARVIRPLQNLSQMANRIAYGDYNAAAKTVSGVREIEDLRQTLNEMAGQVHTAQAAMQDYIGAITRSQEEERKRLARELHDDTIQSLIALQQRVEMAQKALDRDATLVKPKLGELKSLLADSLASVRRFVRDLRPTYLEELGLIPALETLARESNARFSVEGDEQRLDNERELALFRIVQEALRNVTKHARANESAVTG